MVNQQLLEYIKGQEAQGHTEQELRQFLLNQGYPQNEIEEAFAVIAGKPITQQTAPPEQQAQLAASRSSLGLPAGLSTSRT